MLEITVEDYHQYVNKTLKLEERIETLRDKRKRPQIPGPVIFPGVLYGVSFGLESLLGIDNFVKTHDLGSVIGFERGPLFSDSTCERSLQGLDPAKVGELIRQASAKVLSQAEFATTGRIGCYRVAIVDKSTLAGMPGGGVPHGGERTGSAGESRP